MFYSIFNMYKIVRDLHCDIAHFHDPEMLLIAVLLKRKHIKLVYDVHENVHKQILTKEYIPSIFRGALSKLFYALENFVCNRIDAIACATPSIGDRFRAFQNKVYIINNYPLINELFNGVNESQKNWNEIAYVGVITTERGIIQLVEAIGILNGKYKLNLAGRFESHVLYSLVSDLPGWKFVNYYGEINRNEIKDLLNKSSAGIVNFLPAPNHMEAQPNKMFEYMSASLPLMCSDFPLWSQLVDKFKCGVTIDPLNSTLMAAKIDDLLSDPETCKKMGEAGRLAILENFNWDIEEKKLYEIYKDLLNDR